MSRAVLVGVLVAALIGAGGIVGWAQGERPREPLLYGVASLLVPGLGQALQDDMRTGILHFGVFVAIPIVGGTLAANAPDRRTRNIIWGAVGLLQLGWNVYSAVHSYEMAVEYNERHGFALRASLSVALAGP